MQTIIEKKRALTQSFQEISDSPLLDAELILCHVTQKTKTALIIDAHLPLTDHENEAIDQFAKERVAGKPIAYLTGKKAFWTIDLTVTPDTLIPRPETECLVQWILDHFPKDKPLKIADLGTGSGAIAIALAIERPKWIVHATDKISPALDVAKSNAKQHYVKNISFFQGDWCAALPDNDYDLIVSNPPYVAENDHHLSALKYEPITALTAGVDGLDDIKAIISTAKNYLTSTGTLIIEHGFDQQEKIRALFKNTVFSASGLTDLSNQPRFIVAKKRIGILLINLGTPDAPDTKSVRRYLKEFLLDPNVIAIPALLRYLLVYGLILPFRPKQSAHAYQQIWTDKGSPLLVNSVALQEKLSQQLGDEYCVSLGMRYGNPNIAQAVQTLTKDCEHIIVLPLFPQYARATTQSAIDQFLKIQMKTKNTHDIIRDFYSLPAFIDASTQLIHQALQSKPGAFVLFSYHGLPEYQLKNAKKPDYRDQCFITTQLITEKLGLSEHQFQTAFQSRLGRTKWIEPYTDQVINELYERGVRHLIVSCPSFVSDCLETLEEIGMRLRQQWETLGGESFCLVPCLNDDALWVDGLAKMVLDSPHPVLLQQEKGPTV